MKMRTMTQPEIQVSVSQMCSLFNDLPVSMRLQAQYHDVTHMFLLDVPNRKLSNLYCVNYWFLVKDLQMPAKLE